MNKADSKIRKRKHPYLLTILMCTIAIDVMGFGLVLPVFPKLFFTADRIFMGYSVNLSYLFYGLGFAFWPLGNFLGTPYLGLLSDKFGRKKILVICLLLTGISYSLTAVAISMHNITVFLLARLFAGFFGGSYDIAQAGVADISYPENKARNMGLISFAVSVGVILGPALSGITADSGLVSWFDLTTPFWISGLLAFINAIFILIWLKETFVPSEKVDAGLLKVFSSFMFIFTDKRVLLLGLSFLFFQFGWGMYITAMPLILENVFHTTVQGTGFFFCLLGAGIAFSILFIQKRVLDKLHLLKAGLLFLVLLILLSVFLLVFERNIVFEYTAVFMYGICDLLVYTSLLAMSSNSVTEYEQGRVMGGIGAVASLSFFFSGVLTSVLLRYSIRIPIIILFISFLASFIFLLRVKKNKSGSEF